jgi:hypothetical protein
LSGGSGEAAVPTLGREPVLESGVLPLEGVDACGGLPSPVDRLVNARSKANGEPSQGFIITAASSTAAFIGSVLRS